MLAEIYLLKLEAAVRAAKEAATTASTSRFVPVTLPTAKASQPPSGVRHDSLRTPYGPRRPVPGRLRTGELPLSPGHLPACS